MLSAILNSPNYLKPERGAPGRAALLERYDYVLRGMVKLGTLDAAKADQYYGKLPKLAKARSNNMYGGQRGFMLTMVRNELRKAGFDDAQIDSGGLRVETTFTKKAMAAAENGVLQERPPGLKKLHAATASVDVKTGGLIGFYAGQNYLDSQLNWARVGGSPGSSFKPFALAAGLKEGFALKDTFDGNAPFVLPDGGGEVGNQGEGKGQSYGSAISLITATENSVNTAYVDLTTSMEEGPRRSSRWPTPSAYPGRRRGSSPSPRSRSARPRSARSTWPTPTRRSPTAESTTTGSPSRRSPAPPTRRCSTRPPGRTNRALPEDIASDVSYALQQTVQNGTARTALNLGRPAAAKTGTATNDDEDVSSSWFVGYTPQVSTAVMYVRGRGNEALNGYLPTFYGGDYPASTWTAVMTALMEGVEVEDFPPPAFVDGEAPAQGHAPYTPPPPEPKPTEKKQDKPKKKPRSRSRPRPAEEPDDPGGRPRSLRPTPGRTPTRRVPTRASRRSRSGREENGP